MPASCLADSDLFRRLPANNLPSFRMLNPWQRFGLVTLAAVVLFAGDFFLWDGLLSPLTILTAGSLALAYGCFQELRSSSSLPLAHRLLNDAGIVVGLALALVLSLLIGATLLAMQ